MRKREREREKESNTGIEFLMLWPSLEILRDCMNISGLKFLCKFFDACEHAFVRSRFLALLPLARRANFAVS